MQFEIICMIKIEKYYFTFKAEFVADRCTDIFSYIKHLCKNYKPKVTEVDNKLRKLKKSLQTAVHWKEIRITNNNRYVTRSL